MKFLFVLGLVMMVVGYLAVRFDIFPRTPLQKSLGKVSDGDLIMGIAFGLSWRPTARKML